MIIPEALIQPINALQQNMFINAPTISQTAALKCWEPDTLQELEQHVAKYKTSRSILLDQLALLPEIDTMNVAPADGGFYIYIDLGPKNVAAPNHGSVQMCQALLEEEYVAFTPGIDFEDPNDSLGNRRFRISYAGGVERVKMGMERFRRFWPSWLERVHAAQRQQQEEGAQHQPEN
jgi:aspartate/methionine/tyrosine aminotransferase